MASLQPAKLICGIIGPGLTGVQPQIAQISADRQSAQSAESVDSLRIPPSVEEQFGPIDETSAVIPFDFTDYYASEMGADLSRQWVSFAELQPLDRLAEIKAAANRLEDGLRRPDGRRTFNLDPGLLTMHNLVLASTKNYSHRIYLGQGIFAELTLIYEHAGFRALPWTYPDYQSPAALEFLVRVRARYLEELRTRTR